MRHITLDVVDSTNSYFLDNPHLLEEPFLTVRAVNQISGRGRFSRIWESQKGKDLTFSFVVHPMGSRTIASATARTGIAVRRAITAVTGFKPRIKWPNDLLWQEKKLCGILVEHTTLKGKDILVIGIGINLNSENINLEIPAVSIKEITGKEFDADMLLTRIVEEYEALADEPFSQQLISEWNAACGDIGKEVTFSDGRTLLRGVLSGIDPEGEVVILLKDGSEVHYTGELDYAL
jgi:BirA family biotin operon repressor/biotin-[acetyl-CoA-carboxylase] ligase